MSVFGIQAHADGAGKLLDAQVPQDKVELIGEQKTVQDGKVTTTRPLCAYPQAARYKGKGDPNDAASFECAVPK